MDERATAGGEATGARVCPARTGSPVEVSVEALEERGVKGVGAIGAVEIQQGGEGLCRRDHYRCDREQKESKSHFREAKFFHVSSLSGYADAKLSSVAAVRSLESLCDARFTSAARETCTIAQELECETARRTVGIFPGGRGGRSTKIISLGRLLVK